MTRATMTGTSTVLPTEASARSAGRSGFVARLRTLFRSRWMPYVTTPLLVVLFLIGWKIYASVSGLSALVLPPPEAVGKALLEQLGTPHVWTQHIWTTTYETVAGLFWATVIGVPLGFVVGRSDALERIFRPFIVAMQVVPKVALVPIFILWFGFGSTSKVVIAAMLAFFPIFTNTAFGVRSMPRGLEELAASLRLSPWRRLIRFDLPYALPFTLTGLELGVVVGMIGAIVGEYLGGDRGLGRYVVTLQNQLLIAEMFGAIIIMSILGLLFYSVVRVSRQLLVPWHESVRISR